MAQQVDIKGNANFSAIHRAWELADKRTDSFRKQLERVTGTSARAQNSLTQFGSTASGVLTSFAGRITGIAGAMGVLMKTVQVIRAEYEHLKGEQLKKADVISKNAPARANLMLSLDYTDKTLPASALRKSLIDTSIKTGVPLNVLDTAAAETLSSKGENTPGIVAKPAWELAAEMNPLSDNAVKPTALGLMTLKTEDANRDASMKSIAGYMLALQQASKVNDPAKLGENVLPGIANLQSFGLTDREAGALLSTYTNRIGDTYGETSRTAAIGHVKQLRVRTAKAKNGTLKTLTDMMEWLHSDDPEAKSTLAELLGALMEERDTELDNLAPDSVEYSAKSKGFAASIEMLQPGAIDSNSSKKVYQATLAKMPRMSEAEHIYDAQLKQMHSGDQEQIAIMRRKSQAAGEAMRFDDVKGAESAIVRETVADIRSAAGDSKLGTEVRSFFEEFEKGGKLDAGDAISGIEDIKKRRMEKTKDAAETDIVMEPDTGFASLQKTGRTIPGVPLSPEEDVLLRRLDLLKQQFELLQKQQSTNPPANAQQLVEYRQTREEHAQAEAAKLLVQLPGGDAKRETFQERFQTELKRQPDVSPEDLAVRLVDAITRELDNAEILTPKFDEFRSALQASRDANVVPGTKTETVPTVAEERLGPVRSSEPQYEGTFPRQRGGFPVSVEADVNQPQDPRWNEAQRQSANTVIYPDGQQFVFPTTGEEQAMPQRPPRGAVEIDSGFGSASLDPQLDTRGPEAVDTPSGFGESGPPVLPSLEQIIAEDQQQRANEVLLGVQPSQPEVAPAPNVINNQTTNNQQNTTDNRTTNSQQTTTSSETVIDVPAAAAAGREQTSVDMGRSEGLMGRMVGLLEKISTQLNQQPAAAVASRTTSVEVNYTPQNRARERLQQRARGAEYTG